MSEFRHITEDETTEFYFSTTQFSTGAPITLAGTPSVHARVNGSATEITTGITLSVDFDSKTGHHKVAWDSSSSASYAADAQVDFFLAAGTADSVSVVGLQIGPTYKIVAAGDTAALITRALLALPAAAADAAGGLPISDAGGLDLDAQRSDVAAILVDTGTTLQAELDGIQADTEDIQTRLPAALVGGRVDANVGAISSDATAADNAEAFFDGTGYAGTGNTIPTVTNVTNLHASAATAAALATAQADLDILTGSDGVTLATSQPNYAPATASALASLVTTVGVAGVGLTDLGGMSATMRSQAKTEVNASLVLYGLDHLVATAVAGTDVMDNSIFARLVSKENTADWDTYVQTTDSLQAHRDQLATAAGLTASEIAILAEIAALNDLSSSDAQAAVNAALVALHLDHLLAADYDPASKPGVATALLNELVENDAGVSRYTANALEQAPSGGGGGGDTVSVTTEATNIVSEND